MTPEAQDMLESLMQHLLPTPAVSPPKATPIPSEFELLIQRLMGNDQLVQPAPTRRSGFTEMEVLIQNLLPVVAPTQEQPNWESGRRTGRLWCVSRVANRVTRHPGVPFWILCFLFCHRGGRQRGLEKVLLCSHPGFWPNDI